MGRTAGWCVMGCDVLFISPDSDEALDLERMLRPVSITLESVNGLGEARSALAQRSFQVVLTEAFLPDGSWTDVLDLANGAASPPLVIVTDAAADERLWAEVLNLGAYDLLVQPFDSGEVQRILASASRRNLQGNLSRAR